MSSQIKDPFFWNGDQFYLVHADDIYSLFDPEAFGLKPEAPFTACWKGFVVSFAVIEDHLYLKQLDVHCKDDHYPPINGVNAVLDNVEHPIFHIYKGIDLPLSYSGTIIIGDQLKTHYVMRSFTGPHSFEHTYDLTFENGVLVSSKDSTGQYTGF